MFLLNLISTAYAQIGQPPDVGLPKNSLPEMIFQLVTYALVLVGVVALAFFIYGGFLYITAAGDTEQIEKAKKIIVYAIIGIVVIAIAAALVNFVIGAFSGQSQ